MLTYTELRDNPRRCLALTGLSPAEFDLLWAPFAKACQSLYPLDQTAAGRPRQRFSGAGRAGALSTPAQKLLFLLVYLKTYPLQVVMAELFGLSQPRVNYWLHRLLPLLHDALAELEALPERDPQAFAQAMDAEHPAAPLIIDGTERRRQRPKNPENQALHYSGRKKAHSDKNVVVTSAADNRIDVLSQTYPGCAADKGIADQESIVYPPGTVLYKDSGFQGYEPVGTETCQPKKKAAGAGTDGSGEAHQPEVGTTASARGACVGGGEALSHRQGCVAEHQGRHLGCSHGSIMWTAQHSSEKTQPPPKNL